MKLPQALGQRWSALVPRERLLVAGAAVLVIAALTWWVALAPALATLAAAPAQQRALETQLAQMQVLQSQARMLQSQPRIAPAEAVQKLEASMTQRFAGKARLVPSGETASVVFNGVPADALAQWLAQARADAHALPLEAHLQRNAAGLWEGNLILALAR